LEQPRDSRRLLDGEGVIEAADGAAHKLSANARRRNRELQEAERGVRVRALEGREITGLRVAWVLTVDPDSTGADGRDYGASAVGEFVIAIHDAVRLERTRGDAPAAALERELLAA